MIRKAQNPSGHTVIFDEDSHTYFVEETKQQLVSCTKFIKSFTPKFDAEKHSKRIAEKEGATQEEVLQTWEDKKLASLDLGTQVHAYAEAYMMDKKIPQLTNEEALKRVQELIPIMDYLLKTYKILNTEVIIFSERLGISGTIDLLMQKKDTVYIYDWKTNAEIKKHNGWDKYMHYPLEHLEDCNFMHYSLQLNIYKTILIEENYFPKNTKFVMCLFHVTNDGVEPYKVNDMSDEVSQILCF